MALRKGQSSGDEYFANIVEFDLNSTYIAHQDNDSLGQSPDDLSSAERSHRNPGPTEEPTLKISDHNAPSECPALNAGTGGDNGDIPKSSNISHSRELEPEPRLSLGPAPDNVDRSLQTPGISRQKDGSLSPKSSDSSRKGKEVQVTEAGSSSGTQQVDSNPLDTHSMHWNAHGFMPPPYHISSYEHQLRNMAGLYANPDFLYHPSTNVYPGRRQGYFVPGIHLGGQQNPVMFNALETTSAPVHFEFHPYQSSQPMRFNELSMGSSPQNMSQMMLGPNMWRNVPQFPLTINSNVRANVAAERGPAPSLRNISQQPRPQSAVVGNVGTFGGNLTWSYFHQWPAPPRAYERNHVAANQQTASDYPPWSPIHQDGLIFDAQYVDLGPRLNHNRYGYLDLMQLPGPSNQSYNPYLPGPSTFQSIYHPGRPGVPHTVLPMEVPTNTEDWVIPELYDFLFADQGNPSRREHAELPQNLFQPALWSVLEDRYRGMRLDIDNMAYEELSALEDLLGSVSTGLKAETIMGLLKRRGYECSGSDPAAEAETCPICREEYVGEEEIGTLNCGHEFHTDCIKQWLVRKNQCPICKKQGLSP